MADEATIIARTRELLIASPFLDYTTARQRAEAQFGEEALDSLIRQGESNISEWHAAGKPGGEFGYMADTWREDAAVQAAYQADRAGIEPKTSGELAQEAADAWAVVQAESGYGLLGADDPGRVRRPTTQVG